jgi:RNA polymerase sigma-70 factor (ECF subfamily)
LTTAVVGHDADVEDVTALAARAASGDREALELFVRCTQADVWRYCAHMVGPTAADDVTQDTYLRALGAIGSFRQLSSARTWLLGIARRACADALRGRYRRARLAARLVDVAETEVAPAANVPVELTEVVASLDPERREAFVLTQVLGLRYEEVAEVCGCPVGTVKSRVARARLELLDALAEGGEPGRELAT